MIYYTDLGYAFLFLEYCSDALVKSREVIRIMGFFSQCERKHNYLLHALIRLQVQQAFACII